MAQASRMKNNKKNSLSQAPIELVAFVVLLSLCFISALSSIAIASSVSKNKNITSSLSDTQNTLSSSISEPCAQKIKGYAHIQMTEEDISKGNLVLINHDNAFNREVFSELSPINNHNSNAYGIASVNMRANSEVIDPLNTMLTNFYNKTAVDSIYVSSCYRSYEEQDFLHKQEIINIGEEEAKYWVAQAGYSEHHSGYAVDLALMDENGITTEYNGTGQFSMLNKSAPDYGFIVRYSDDKKDITGIYYEPWHFRYIGLPHSKICTELSMCFEEYIDCLRKYTPDGEHLKYTYKNTDYEIYFCKGTDVYVPENSDYTISGNNVDGFIVTIKK